jgi:DNA-binding transcriptional ArsR family regulator
MLEKLMGSRVRAKIIEWFYSRPEERCFGRRLAALIDEDSTNVSRELARLGALGVLSCREEGRQKYYRANAYCPIYKELLGIARKTAGRPGVVSDTGIAAAAGDRYSWLWDVDMDARTFRTLLSGNRKVKGLDWKWAMARLIDYAPYGEIRRLLPEKRFLARWREVAPLVTSDTRREGMNYLHEILRKKTAAKKKRRKG